MGSMRDFRGRDDLAQAVQDLVEDGGVAVDGLVGDVGVGALILRGDVRRVADQVGRLAQHDLAADDRLLVLGHRPVPDGLEGAVVVDLAPAPDVADVRRDPVVQVAAEPAQGAVLGGPAVACDRVDQQRRLDDAIALVKFIGQRDQAPAGAVAEGDDVDVFHTHADDVGRDVAHVRVFGQVHQQRRVAGVPDVIGGAEETIQPVVGVDPLAPAVDDEDAVPDTQRQLPLPHAPKVYALPGGGV